MPSTALQPMHGSFLMPSLEHATVADAMHPGIVSCDPGATATEVARIMVSQHVHCVAVMGLTHEPGGDSLVWGIISDLDLMRSGIGSGGDETAATLAKQPIISVEPSTSLREAGELMLSHGVSHLVVVEPQAQRPVGIVSTLDLAGVLAWGEA
jgi:CBS domain-containing protein